MPKADPTDTTQAAPRIRAPMNLIDALDGLTDGSLALSLAVDGLEYMLRDGNEIGPRDIDALRWHTNRVRDAAEACSAAAEGRSRRWRLTVPEIEAEEREASDGHGP